MEIVSEPDMRYVRGILAIPTKRVKPNDSSPEEAAEYVRTLQAVLRTVGSSDGNMEQVNYLFFIP